MSKQQDQPRRMSERAMRNEAISHYMADPATRDRFLKQLRSALCDPTYVLRRGFDWPRFAHEFTVPDFSPPFEKWELFSALREHFSPPGRREPPTHRIWWTVRIAIECDDPDKWLLEQQRSGKGRRWASAVARLLGCRLTGSEISRYASIRAFGTLKPKIPSQFKTKDTRILALVEDHNDYGQKIIAWGLAYVPFRRWPLAWKTILRDKVIHLPDAQKKPPKEESLQIAVESLIERHDFRPGAILFYTGHFLFRDTGELLWPWDKHTNLWEMDIDYTGGFPVRVEGWNEDGWPVGRRIRENNSTIKQLPMLDNLSA